MALKRNGDGAHSGTVPKRAHNIRPPIPGRKLMLKHPRATFSKYFRMREILTPEEADAARKQAEFDKADQAMHEAVRTMWAQYFEKLRAKRRRTAKPLWQLKSMGGR